MIFLRFTSIPSTPASLDGRTSCVPRNSCTISWPRARIRDILIEIFLMGIFPLFVLLSLYSYFLFLRGLYLTYVKGEPRGKLWTPLYSIFGTISGNGLYSTPSGNCVTHTHEDLLGFASGCRKSIWNATEPSVAYFLSVR